MDKVKCEEHSGLCTEVKNLGKQSDEARDHESRLWAKIDDIKDSMTAIQVRIAKIPSLRTILIVVGIVCTVLSTVVGLAYWSHQGRMTRLENTDAVIFQKMGENQKSISDQLKELRDCVTPLPSKDRKLSIGEIEKGVSK